MSFLDALADTWGMTETPEEEASVAAEQLADAVTAWLTGDPGHEVERKLERVEQNLERVEARPEGELLAKAVTLLRRAYDSGSTADGWQLADMVRQVADCLAVAA